MHHQQFSEAEGTENALIGVHLRMIQVVALTARDLLTDDAFFDKVKQEWEGKLQQHLST